MEQLSLLKPRRPRYARALAVYRDTSARAFESFRGHVAEVDALILDDVYAHNGATCADLEDRTGLKHQTVSAQIRHMFSAGLLEDSGERRVPAGRTRTAIVWRLPRRREEAAAHG